jgi:hypothetical protein
MIKPTFSSNFKNHQDLLQTVSVFKKVAKKRGTIAIELEKAMRMYLLKSKIKEA